MEAPSSSSTARLLLFGASGWIGRMIAKAWSAGDLYKAKARLEDPGAVVEELDGVDPTHVIVAAGLTGRPNVDWCEDHKAEVLAVNFAGTLALAQACAARNIHCTLVSSGCVFQYSRDHPNVADVDKGFDDADVPNFAGSFYSRTKAMLETTLRALKLPTLVLRLRMPIANDGSPRCLLTKLESYKDHVADGFHESITYLPDLVPLIPVMALARLEGTLNLVQPGGVTNREILEMARPAVAREARYIGGVELAKRVRAPRSHCVLQPRRLADFCRGLGVHLRSARACLRDCLPEAS